MPGQLLVCIRNSLVIDCNPGAKDCLFYNVKRVMMNKFLIFFVALCGVTLGVRACDSGSDVEGLAPMDGNVKTVLPCNEAVNLDTRGDICQKGSASASCTENISVAKGAQSAGESSQKRENVEISVYYRVNSAPGACSFGGAWDIAGLKTEEGMSFRHKFLLCAYRLLKSPDDDSDTASFLNALLTTVDQADYAGPRYSALPGTEPLRLGANELKLGTYIWKNSKAEAAKEYTDPLEKIEVVRVSLGTVAISGFLEVCEPGVLRGRSWRSLFAPK